MGGGGGGGGGGTYGMIIDNVPFFSFVLVLKTWRSVASLSLLDEYRNVL